MPEVDQQGLDSSEDPLPIEKPIEEPQEEQAPIEEEQEADLSQVDARLEVAMYYRELLRTELFSDTCSAARFVSGEIRDFAKSRLSVLMGVTEGVVSPSVKAPKKDEPIPVVKKKAPVQAPQKSKPWRPTPIAPIQPRGFASSQPARKPAPDPSVRRVENENGQVMAIVGGKKFVKAESQSEPGKFYVKDVTPVVADPHAVPMPQGSEQWESITGDHAARSVNASKARSDKLVQNAAAMSIVSPAATTSTEE